MFNKAELEIIKSAIKKRSANNTIILMAAKKNNDARLIAECEETNRICKSIIAKIDNARGVRIE